MKNKHFNLTSGIVLILIPLVFSFTGCKDDYETYYEGYGLVSKSGDEKFTVKLDDGYLLYPREYYFNPEKLNDSTLYGYDSTFWKNRIRIYMPGLSMPTQF